MKRFPHKPKAKDLEECRQTETRRYQLEYVPGIPQAIADRNERWFFTAWRMARDLASLEYGLEASLAAARELLVASCQHAENAVEFGYVINPAYFNIWLCQANMCNQQVFRKRLEQMTRADYTNPNMKADELSYMACEIMTDLSAGRPREADARIAVALANLTGKFASLDALVRSAQAILAKDTKAFDNALDTRIAAHIQSYSSSDVRHYPGGLIDLVALGTIKIAQRYGLQPTLKSVYLPVELILD